jgi:DMSO/TMAO reductase YedYZ molybdopterin-dependent catalytic subunit
MSIDHVTMADPLTAVAVPSALAVVREEPFNAETPLCRQAGVITPNHLFYVRNHNATPNLTAREWRLQVGGQVRSPLVLTYDDIVALPSRSLPITMECAGNGRASLHPKAPGEQWTYGAVSTAWWLGVPLRTVLDAAGLLDGVKEILFAGADRGVVKEGAAPIPFERSLPLEKALHPDTLLAYGMNGEPLSAAHGFPMRLIVPGWYGVASVKWITRVEALTECFAGYFQAERYVMVHPESHPSTSTPLTTMRVRSLITNPLPDAVLTPGTHVIEGLAWSGVAPIRSVEISTAGGMTWSAAETISEPLPYAWQRWRYVWQAKGPGQIKLCSRAVDAAGSTQPTDPEWNCLGYSNNAVQVVPVTIG